MKWLACFMLGFSLAVLTPDLSFVRRLVAVSIFITGIGLYVEARSR